MSKLYNAAKKAFFEPIKKTVTKIAQKTSGQGPTRGETIKYVKPKLTNLQGEISKAKLKAKSDVQKKFGPVNEGIRKETTQLRQTLQNMRGEPVTKSGISKGKDITPGIYESKLDVDKRNKGSQKLFEASKGRKFNKGGRVGLKRGTFPDYSGDGKTTMKDILMGRGVIPKPKDKKKKMMAKKSKSPMAKAVRKA